MTPTIRTLVVAALATPGLLLAQRGGQPAAGAAGAAGAPACNIETMSPSSLGLAYLQRQKVVAAKSPEEAKKAISDAMKALFDDKNKSNPMGRDFMLAQFYVFAAEYGEVQTRGALGIPGDKNANVDLITGADSLFSIIEKAQPACTSETAQWREYKPYQALTSAAYAMIKVKNTDSADKLVKRAQLLSRNGAQVYDILWRVAQQKGDETGQITNLQLAADKLIGDTLNGSVRANFLFNLGRIQQDFASKKTDKAAQSELQHGAVKAYMSLIKEFPQAEETPFALSGISQAATATGDTSLAVGVVEMIKGATDKYSDVTLAQAGVVATRANKSADA